MSITSRFFVQFSIGLIVVGFLALFAIIGMTIWLGDRAQVYFNEVIEARDTRASAVELRNAVQLAESSQRGFLVTGNEIYLAPYSTARSLAYRQLDEVKRNLAPYKETGPAVQRMATIVSEKFSEMDETIALKRARKDAAALAAFRTNRGKALMDEANVFFSAVIQRADDRLTAGVSEQRANAATLRLVSIIAGIVITFVVGGVIVTVFQYTRELAQARDLLSVMNTTLEERVKVRTADLAQANDEIQRFAYIVTHDLRAPLVNIMGFTSELEASVRSLQALIGKSKVSHDPDDPLVKEAGIATVDLAEAIGFIRSSTKKMDNLINAILKLSREGRRQLQPEQIELRDVIKTSAAAIQHQLSAANGEIIGQLNVPVFNSDRLSLEQVFGNLFDNAVKYRSSLRPLRIIVRACLEANDRIAIEIADNGRGIADQDLERVFELFRRAGTQDQPGEGIGLAQVRTIIRNLGGDITVTSALDKGTTFYIILPRQLVVPGSSAK
jgi:signal transduction histidine kinase